MRRLALILTLLALSMAISANLLWDEEIAIRQGVNIEWFRTGIDTHDGCAIYVWSDTKLGERDLWAQKVDAQGNMVWGEPVLIDGKPDRQEDPTITRTSDNNYVIAWIDFFDDPDGNVYAQKINADGQRLWQEGGVPVCTAPAVQLSINMEPDQDGGVFMVWMDARNPSKDIYGQRLNANGDAVWAPNGIPIADDIGDEVQNTMLPDGTGGMMIGYTVDYGGDEDIYVKRFLGDGTMAWDNALPLAVGAESQGKVRMAAIGNGEFIFTWQDQAGNDPNIMAQKVNLAGQAVWPQTVAVYSDLDADDSYPQENPRIVGTSDNAAIIVWEDKRLDTQDPDLFAQKINASGQLLWDANGVALSTAPFAQFGPRMASDGAGGCYVVWDDRRNGNTPNEDVYAQHLSATGEALWGAGGKPICTAANTQEGSLVKVAGDNIFINWMDMRNGSIGLYYQVLNSSGNVLLEADGKEVFWGLSGDAPLNNYLVLPRANDIAIIWQDTRFANIGYQIFFQYLNPDGTIALETNGRSATTSTGYDQSDPQAVVTPDGHIYLAWIDNRHEHPRIYMQLLSPTGERLWGDTGVPLTEMAPIDQKDPKLYYDASIDGLYVGWSNSDDVGEDRYPLHTWGQFFQNGQKMWGPNGKLISVLDDATMHHECSLSDLVDGYYLWSNNSPETYNGFVYVNRIDPSGNPYPGWPEEGIAVHTRDDYGITQDAARLARTDSGIFVMYRDKLGSGGTVHYRGQHFSESGERLWDETPMMLSFNGLEQDKAALVKDGRTDCITFVWDENLFEDLDIHIQRIGLDGSFFWQPQGKPVVQKPGNQTEASVVSFDANNGLLVAWADYSSTEESDIYYKYIHPSGNFLTGSSEGGDVMCDALKKQYQPKLVTVGDYAYAVWADGRSSGKTEILGLYAQKLGNPTTPNDDYTLPAPMGFRLMQNHPNPFNPSTTIAFEITDATKDYRLDIYNIKGQLVKTLHNGKLIPGRHSVVWNGQDKNDKEVASGVYFYRLDDGQKAKTRKMLLMK